MASKLPTNIDNNDLLFVKKLIKGKLVYCGYKRDYLARNLSLMEQNFILCKICKGIMRQATVNKGETTCLMCSENPSKLTAVNMVQDTVVSLEIKCPLLKYCEWDGKLSEAEEHLMTCGFFQIECSNCKQSFFRKDDTWHNTILCPLRSVQCEYKCGKSGPANELEKHYQVCANFPVICSNGCGIKIQRRNVSAHGHECDLGEIACPFSEFGCKAKPMQRRNLKAHKKEFVVEHQDYCLEGMRERISKLEKENIEMSWKLKTMKQLDGVEWVIEKPYDIENGQRIQGPAFYVNNFKLRLFLRIEYDPDLGYELHFSIKRIEGEFDRQLGIAFITHY